MEIRQQRNATTGHLAFIVLDENGCEVGLYHATLAAAQRFAAGYANPRKSRKVRGWSVQG